MEQCPTSSAFKRGDKVFGGGLGAFAEYIVAEEQAVRRIPEGWSLQDAAGMAATAPVSYGALVRVAKVQPGEVVLVHAAAGGLGVMAVQIAKALGARVIGTVGNREKMRVVEELGADVVIDYGEEKWEDKVLEATEGQGVDVTFDTVGLVERSIRCSKYNARIVIAGFAGREGNLEKVAANRILLKSITVLGYRFGEHGRRFPEETPAVWRGLEDILRKGKIKPVIYDQPFDGLESVPSAMNAMADRKVWGKAIINVSHETPDSKL